MSRARSGRLLMTAIMAAATLTGCGYMVGNAYQADIRTVHVPIFESDDFRRGVEFQLTEAVQREIQRTTPFRIAKGPYADTRLTGRIVNIRKLPLSETRFDDPRELELQYVVEVTWEDLRTGRLLAEQQVPIEADTVQLISTASFAPELGHSLATATQEAIDRMARQIVELMEVPW